MGLKAASGRLYAEPRTCRLRRRARRKPLSFRSQPFAMLPFWKCCQFNPIASRRAHPITIPPSSARLKRNPYAPFVFIGGFAAFPRCVKPELGISGSCSLASERSEPTQKQPSCLRDSARSVFGRRRAWRHPPPPASPLRARPSGPPPCRDTKSRFAAHEITRKWEFGN